MFKTREEYRTAWNNAYSTTPEIPLNVDIELASLCNLRCPFCFYGEAEWHEEMSGNSWDGLPKKRIMPTTTALAIIIQASEIGVPAIKFNWRGESTLHPDYSKILIYARNIDCFHDILVNTNANCKDAAIDGLMAATKCMISLDSVVPETYAKMRVNGRLERAVEVGKELIRRGHSNLWFRRVITKFNEGENFKAGVDEIFGGKGYKVSEHFCVDRGDDFHAVNNPAQYERTYCGYPSQRIMVASDGICYPCCADTDGLMPMGNIHKQRLSEIWSGSPFMLLRKQLRSNVFHSEICKKCESWMAYKAPQRDFVSDVEVK